MLDKKQTQRILLFELKMGRKSEETTHISNTFGPRTGNKHTAQWWFKKYCKWDESLEDEECSGWPSEVDNDQLKAIINADHLKTTWEVVQPRPFYSCLALEANRKDEKARLSGYLMSWPQIKKIIILKCHLLLFYAKTTNHFLAGLWHAMKSGFYMTTRGNQLSGWTKMKLQSISQSLTCTKKRSW